MLSTLISQPDTLPSNPNKCCYLFISRKRVHSKPPTLGHAPLSHVSSYKYLGLLPTSCGQLISPTSARKQGSLLACSTVVSINTLLAIHCSNYVSFIEYAAASWDPHLRKDNRSHRRCAKVCTQSLSKILDCQLSRTTGAI